MFQIDPLSGFWTIKHLTCGASFQMTGDKINMAQRISCPNCGIPLHHGVLQAAVNNLDLSLRAIEQVTGEIGNPPDPKWQITPPITVLEEEGSTSHN